MRIAVMAVTLCLAALDPANFQAGNMAVPNQDERVTQVKGLWSRNPHLRAAVKARILDAGTASIRHVITLLAELVETVGEPHLSVGPPSDAPLEYESEQDITWRLIDDCCELLGLLNARGGVRLLIRVIELPKVAAISLGEGRSAAVSALIRIGKPAESALIDELKNAFQRAAPRVGQGIPDGDEKRRFLQEHHAHEIQVQVCAVLESIGDETTSKALETLLRSDADLNSHSRSVIELTINRIRSRPGFRLHRY